MIEFTKSARIAFESLQKHDKKNFTRWYRQARLNPISILSCDVAKKLPDIENTYMINISKQLRAILQLTGKNDFLILEIVKQETLNRIFAPMKHTELAI